jgi:hypothetical protein
LKNVKILEFPLKPPGIRPSFQILFRCLLGVMWKHAGNDTTVLGAIG